MVQSQVTNKMALVSIWSSSENHTRQSGCADYSNAKSCLMRTLVSLSYLSFGVKALLLKQPPRCYRTHMTGLDSNVSWRLRLSTTKHQSSFCNVWDSDLNK